MIPTLDLIEDSNKNNEFIIFKRTGIKQNNSKKQASKKRMVIKKKNKKSRKSGFFKKLNIF